MLAYKFEFTYYISRFYKLINLSNKKNHYEKYFSDYYFTIHEMFLCKVIYNYYKILLVKKHINFF
jgi:hypothetical protein